MKKIIITSIIFLVVLFAGCNKVDEQTVLPTSTPKCIPTVVDAVEPTVEPANNAEATIIPAEEPIVTIEAEITPSETEGATGVPAEIPVVTEIPTNTSEVETATSSPTPTPEPTATSTPTPTLEPEWMQKLFVDEYFELGEEYGPNENYSYEEALETVKKYLETEKEKANKEKRKFCGICFKKRNIRNDINSVWK